MASHWTLEEHLFQHIQTYLPTYRVKLVTKEIQTGIQVYNSVFLEVTLVNSQLKNRFLVIDPILSHSRRQLGELELAQQQLQRALKLLEKNDESSEPILIKWDNVSILFDTEKIRIKRICFSQISHFTISLPVINHEDEWWQLLDELQTSLAEKHFKIVDYMAHEPI